MIGNALGEKRKLVLERWSESRKIHQNNSEQVYRLFQILHNWGIQWVLIKFWRSGVPLRDSSSRRIPKLWYLSRIEGEANMWWFMVEIINIFLTSDVTSYCICLVSIWWREYSKLPWTVVLVYNKAMNALQLMDRYWKEVWYKWVHKRMI